MSRLTPATFSADPTVIVNPHPLSLPPPHPNKKERRGADAMVFVALDRDVGVAVPGAHCHGAQPFKVSQFFLLFLSLSSRLLYRS